MDTPESLPSRPLDVEEANELEERNDVDAVIPFMVDDCACNTDTVEHFFVRDGEEYVGFDFDAEEGWVVRSRGPTWSEAKTAFTENRAAETAE